MILIVAIVLSAVLGIGGGVGSYVLLSQSNSTTSTDNGLTINKSSTTGGSEGSADGTVLSTKEISNKVADSVVEIVTETVSYSYFYGQGVSEGAGSGVIIDNDGYIITNNHVIEDAKSIKVTLRNGNEYDAKLIGADSDQDIALIKIEPKSGENLTVATFGDSDKLSVGDKAVVIGNPLGQLGGTVTDGIISALDRELTIDEKTMNLLQTNAAINPGNSGGGLFDGQGNLVGIVVAKASSSSSTSSSVEGLGFAIPINDAESILSDLKEYGYVKGKPAEIGVTLQDYMDMVYIYSVTDNSPADKAGLEKGDKIMTVGGKEVTSSSDVKNAISKSKAGDKLKIQIERNGETKTCTVTIAEQTQSSTTEETTSYQYDGDSGNSIWDNYGF
jgi:serine protease Do